MGYFLVVKILFLLNKHPPYRAVSALVAHQVVVKYVRYSASVECDGGRLSANNGPENNVSLSS